MLLRGRNEAVRRHWPPGARWEACLSQRGTEVPSLYEVTYHLPSVERVWCLLSGDCGRNSPVLFSANPRKAPQISVLCDAGALGRS